MELRRRKNTQTTSSVQSQQEKTRSTHVVYVHGTFAPNSGKPGSYAAPGGEMSEVLKDKFHAKGYSAYDWSGGGTERDRKEAGEHLAKGLSKKFDGDENVHLVGHSHGGNVIGHALQHLPPERMVSSVTMLGTPHWDPSQNPSWNRSASSHVTGPVTTLYSQHDPVQTTGAELWNAKDRGAPTSSNVHRELDSSTLSWHSTVVNRDVSQHTVGPGPQHHSSLHYPEVLKKILD